MKTAGFILGIVLSFGCALYAEDFYSIKRNDIDEVIESYAIKMYPYNKEAQKYVIELQTSAYKKLMKVERSGVYGGILDKVIHQYYPDFDTILYVYEEERKEYNKTH